MGKRRFAASVTGDSSTEAARYGSRSVSAHVRGWNHGIKVRAYANQHGRDEFEIWTTNGSNDDSEVRLVARIDANDIYEVATLVVHADA